MPFRGRRLLGAVSVCALLAGCGPCDGDDEREAAAPPPAAPTASPTVPAATPTPTPQSDDQQLPAGELAVGLTEQNPNFIWPAGAREVPPQFARWRDELAKLKPRVLPARARLAVARAGGRQAGLRLAQRRLHARQAAVRLLCRAARSAPGAGRAPARGRLGDARRDERHAGVGGAAGRRLRARQHHAALTSAARHGHVHAVRRAGSGRGAQQGAELRYWSPWNEPNHPYFISPQRLVC